MQDAQYAWSRLQARTFRERGNARLKLYFCAMKNNGKQICMIERAKSKLKKNSIDSRVVSFTLGRFSSSRVTMLTIFVWETEICCFHLCKSPSCPFEFKQK